MLETSEWIVLNSIIYKMYSIDDMDTMRENVVAALKNLIDFQGCCFFLSSTNGASVESPVIINGEKNSLMSYMNNYMQMDYGSGIFMTGKNFVYRESDIMPEQDRIRTEYYQKIYRPNNWHYSLHMNLSHEQNFVGSLSLFRNSGQPDFSQKDIFVLEMLKDMLALRLFQYLKSRGSKKTSFEEITGKSMLTQKETEVLKGILQGKDSRELCEELYITQNTLKKHFNSIYQKTGINSKAKLIQQIVL